MTKLNVAPTKSNLLSLKRQLAFAQEGYDLLEQKRQILILELMTRLSRARQVEHEMEDRFKRAYAAIREATLTGGPESLDRAALAVTSEYDLRLSDQHLMGMRIPRCAFEISPPLPRFGVEGTVANTDVAMLRFLELLPWLAELAEIQNAIQRLARELRKTQRRCNALSKIFIPAYRLTIAYIAGTLEERERESLVFLKMIRNRLAQSASTG